MQKMPYQVPEALRDDPLLSWRYSEETKEFFSLKELPDDFQHDGFHTEHDLIAGWMNFSREAFHPVQRISHFPCWEGHIEQFGLLMLQIALSSDKRGQDGFGNAELIDVIFPKRELGEHGYWDPMISRDSLWYNAWFSMIGHPDFQFVDAQIGQITLKLQSNKFALRYAAELLIENGQI